MEGHVDFYWYLARRGALIFRHGSERQVQAAYRRTHTVLSLQSDIFMVGDGSLRNHLKRQWRLFRIFWGWYRSQIFSLIYSRPIPTHKSPLQDLSYQAVRVKAITCFLRDT